VLGVLHVSQHAPAHGQHERTVSLDQQGERLLFSVGGKAGQKEGVSGRIDLASARGAPSRRLLTFLVHLAVSPPPPSRSDQLLPVRAWGVTRISFFPEPLLAAERVEGESESAAGSDKKRRNLVSPEPDRVGVAPFPLERILPVRIRHFAVRIQTS